MFMILNQTIFNCGLNGIMTYTFIRIRIKDSVVDLAKREGHEKVQQYTL